MHPAWSVILLTTLIGVGQGLFAALVAVQALSLVPAGAAFYWAGAALAFGFLAAGLIASFFHLGRPERAWRSVAMWRTSWLSREVIVLPAFMACVAAFGLGHALGLPGVGSARTLAIGALGILAVRGAVRLHRHDLRLPAFPAGMAYAAHGDQLHAVRLRSGFHARDRLCGARRAGARPALGGVDGWAHAGGRWSRAPQRSPATRGSSRSRRCRPRSA